MMPCMIRDVILLVEGKRFRNIDLSRGWCLALSSRSSQILRYLRKFDQNVSGFATLQDLITTKKCPQSGTVQ